MWFREEVQALLQRRDHKLIRTWAHSKWQISRSASQTKGLETIEHQGPSTVGIDTIYKSRLSPVSSVTWTTESVPVV